MLPRLFTDPLSLGFAQASVAAAMALAVMWLSRSWAIHVERETVVALARGIVQVVLVGSVLVVLLQGPLWTSAIVLSVMVGAASATAARRAKDIPGALWASSWGMAIGSGVVILLGAIIGVIDVRVASIVPVGSMIIANGMNAAALALDRFRAEVVSQTGRIEASLALGADPAVSVAPYLQSAMHASMTDRTIAEVQSGPCNSTTSTEPTSTTCTMPLARATTVSRST
ncbi:MAG TPA: ABC transporter permease, partial [Chloroflexota bacterium]|nr:ABC transporter permease [Chloroflexota bacterium]